MKRTKVKQLGVRHLKSGKGGHVMDSVIACRHMLMKLERAFYGDGCVEDLIPVFDDLVERTTDMLSSAKHTVQLDRRNEKETAVSQSKENETHEC